MNEYEIRITVRAKSTLDKERLKQLLVIALLDDLTMIPDGATDELEVIEYDDITVEEAL
jgi:hypothetical protein